MALMIPLDVSATPQTVPLAVGTPVEQTVNGDYEQLANLPQISGVTLIGDKSAADLGLVDADDYAPVEKTAAMTQPVGKGADGKLYTTPGAGAVSSVNGETGDVELDAQDVGALPVNADLDDIPDGTTYKRATAAQLAQIATNANDIDAIEAVIPSAASASNQLADKAYVADSIIQGTAIYRGAFASYAALMAVAWQTTNPDAANYVSNNDYAYVLDDETHSDECWRYLYVTGTGWTAQIRVNETPFTQAQLAALNSGATAEIISSVADKYVKPSGGIPASDLASAVQTSLSKADTALQSVPNTYRTAAAQDLIDAGKQPTVEIVRLM